jgi:hypothetical protein
MGVKRVNRIAVPADAVKAAGSLLQQLQNNPIV